jgi:HK97 family phage major capsid protein
MTATDNNVAVLRRDPERIARQISDHLGKLSRTALDTELVYTPLGRHSYYRDLIVAEHQRVGETEARGRLERHGEQMDLVRAARESRVSYAGFEFRVTPDRTDGHGGYFAPPLWLNELFATANRPGRVLAGLMARFPLPPGVSSVNVPLLSTGSAVQPAVDDAAVVDRDITDSEASSQVVPFGGQADVALQLLEQSPVGAHLDWALFLDLSEGYDYDLEQQLLTGTGEGVSLTGVTKVSGVTAVTYTDASPSGKAMWPMLAKTAAQVGDARLRPPECWLMRTARWAWLNGAEDTAERPFGLSTQIYLGSDDDTPDPIGGLMGWPVFLNDAIPATQGTGANQDQVICQRPRDLILLEGEPQTLVSREPLSGSLGVRLQMHCNAAALTSRRPGGIGVLSGSGMTVGAGY